MVHKQLRCMAAAREKKLPLAAITVMALLLFWNVPIRVRAASGDLDPAFGTGGKVTTNFYDHDLAFALALQSDGKIVLAGTASRAPSGTGSDFALARYNSNGTLDGSFGVDGKVTTDFAGYREDEANDIAIQSDGRIVVAGTVWKDRSFGQSDIALARYNTDGSLDLSFGSSGLVTSDFFDSVEVAGDLALQADGKVVVTGNSGGLAILARYQSDGSLDVTFGSSGRVFTALLRATDVAIQSDGEILVGGPADAGGGRSGFGLARFNSNGSLDSAFGSSGKAIADFSGRADGAANSALAIHPDGSIVTVGSTSSFNPVLRDFALARFDSGGNLDLAFGLSGMVTTDIGRSADTASAVAIQPNGGIVAAGSAVIGDYNIALARYNPDGSLDPLFGSEGIVLSDLFGSDDQAYSVAITSSGGILAAGYSEVRSTGADFALACYQSNLATPPEITGAEVSGKKLYVYGKNFDNEASILLNNEKQKKTFNDDTTPSSLLVAKKSGKKIARGEQVALQVRNSDGRLSNQFMFTRPVE